MVRGHLVRAVARSPVPLRDAAGLPARLRSAIGPWRWTFAAVVIVGVASHTFFTLATRPVEAALVIEATFDRQACCVVELSVNANAEPSSALPIRPGRRHRYELDFRATRLDEFNVNWGRVRGSAVVIHNLLLTKGGDRIHRWEPLEIQFIGVDDAGAPTGEPNHSWRFVAEGDAPAWSQVRADDLVTPVGRWLLDRVERPEGTLLAALLVGGVALSATAWAAARRWTLLAVACLASLAIGLHFVPDFVEALELRDSVAVGVSQSAYRGEWKTPDVVMHAMVLFLAVSLGGMAAWAFRWHRRGATAPLDFPDSEDAATSGTSRWAARWGPAIPIGLMALYLMPDLSYFAGLATSPSIPFAWDDQNLLLWRFLATSGEVPLRDFWFPYGAHDLFYRALPWPVVLNYLSDLAVWSYCWVGAHLVLKRLRPGALAIRYSAFVAVVLLVTVATREPLSSRYVMPCGLLFLFAAIESDVARPRTTRVLFAIALTHALFLDAFQVAVAAPALVVFRIVEASSGGRPTLRSAARRLFPDLMAAGAAGVVWCLGLSLRGQLPGAVEFYAHLRDFVAYTAWPQVPSFASWLRVPARPGAFAYWAMPLGVAMGMYGVLTSRRGSRTAHGLILAFGVLSFAALQKQVVRGGDVYWGWMPWALAGLLWPVLIADWRSKAARVIAGASLGAALTVVIASGALADAAERVRDSASNAVHNVGSIVLDRDVFDRANAQSFAPDRFDDPDLPALRRAVLAAGLVPQDRLFVLDVPGLYVFLGRTDPYYLSNVYDASPVHWQRRLVQELKDDPPAVSVIDSTQLSFDAVPNVVRLPIVYRWLVASFRPDEDAGKYRILTKRPTGEPIDFAGWRDLLGGVIDLGHVPEVTKVRGNQRCTRDCAAFLEFTFRSASHARLPKAVEVPIKVGDTKFTIRFATSPGVRRYVVNLDRIWFWSTADVNDRRIDLSGFDPSSVRVEQVDRTRTDHSLY